MKPYKVILLIAAIVFLVLGFVALYADKPLSGTMALIVGGIYLIITIIPSFEG
jgi:FtsH-binding integral membrane protein